MAASPAITPKLNRRRVAPLAVGVVVPVLALLLGAGLYIEEIAIEHLPGPIQIGVSLLVLGFTFWTVFVTLTHAEAIAHRVGEPFGTLVLTLAVTVIEASVIVSVMLHGAENPGVARESVFSTVMIVCGGIVGTCLVLGGWRHRQLEHKRQGTSALLAVVVALSMLTLVLPNYTLAAEPGEFSPIQLIFVSTLCILLYGAFIYAQMTYHREDFIDVHPSEAEETGEREASPAPAPTGGMLKHFVLLMVGLFGIVLLAEHVAAGIEEGLDALKVTQTDAIVGAFIATLVLMPETVAAIRAALRNEPQRSLNIALGSICSTIGLTIPVVAMASLITGHQLTLGLGPGDTVLLALALALSIISFGTGRTTVLTGLVHLVVFVAYLLLVAVP